MAGLCTQVGGRHGVGRHVHHPVVSRRSPPPHGFSPVDRVAPLTSKRKGNAMQVATELSYASFQTVYNVLSFALASMIFTALFLLISQGRVLPRYRNALVVSATVCGIAAYHYFRIFDSFRDAYIAGGAGQPLGADGLGGLTYALVAGDGFNEGYRYVDWLLTVPLLLFETIAVLALARSDARSLLNRLIPASVLMIVLGYPGEISSDVTAKLVWGTLSTIPFIYILYVLFAELSKSLDRQPAEVRGSVGRLRILLIATWGVYPISYLFPVLDSFGLAWFGGEESFVLRQVGYSIADVLAKCLYGLVIYKIARLKSFADSAEFAASEGEAPSSEKQAA